MTKGTPSQDDLSVADLQLVPETSSSNFDVPIQAESEAGASSSQFPSGAAAPLDWTGKKIKSGRITKKTNPRDAVVDERQRDERRQRWQQKSEGIYEKQLMEQLQDSVIPTTEVPEAQAELRVDEEGSKPLETPAHEPVV